MSNVVADHAPQAGDGGHSRARGARGGAAAVVWCKRFTASELWSWPGIDSENETMKSNHFPG